MIEALQERIEALERIVAVLTHAVSARDAIIAERDAEIVFLKAENSALKVRITTLEAKLNTNSRNSSKPPSTDPPWKKAKPKGQGKRKQGAQNGHRGINRELLPIEEVNAVVLCKPVEICPCGGAIVIDEVFPERRQVFEIPKIQPHVTEYQIFTGCCGDCCTKVRGDLPIGTPSGMLGPRALAMIAMLSGKFKQSKRDIEELLATFFGLFICVGTVCNAEQQVSEALAVPHQELAAAVQQEPILNADETGHKVAGKRAWMWVALSAAFVVFYARLSRSKKVAQEILGANFSGVLISDRYNAYLWVEKRQLCWAHLIRDFTKLKESTGPSSIVANQILDYVTKMFVLWHGFQDGELTRTELQEDMLSIRFQITALLEQGRDMPIAGKLCKDLLIKHMDSLWRFVDSEGIEPTNNNAERTVRQYVIWRKTSFGTQGEHGNRFIERILTAIGTCQRQNRNVLDYLIEAVTARLHNLPAPSLLPQAV